MFCPQCGKPLDSKNRCAACGVSLGTGGDGDAGLGLIVPLNVEPVSMIASYAALFGLLISPLGLVAFPMGIIGLRRCGRDPSVRGKARAWVAIVLGGLEAAFFLFILGTIVYSMLAEG